MAGAGTTRSVTVVRVVVTRFAARLRITWRLTILCLGEMVVERTVRTVSTVSTGTVATGSVTTVPGTVTTGSCATSIEPGCWVMTVSTGRSAISRAITVWAFATDAPATSAAPRTV